MRYGIFFPKVSGLRSNNSTADRHFFGVVRSNTTGQRAHMFINRDSPQLNFAYARIYFNNTIVVMKKLFSFLRIFPLWLTTNSDFLFLKLSMRWTCGKPAHKWPLSHPLSGNVYCSCNIIIKETSPITCHVPSCSYLDIRPAASIDLLTHNKCGT